MLVPTVGTYELRFNVVNAEHPFPLIPLDEVTKFGAFKVTSDVLSIISSVGLPTDIKEGKDKVGPIGVVVIASWLPTEVRLGRLTVFSKVPSIRMSAEIVCRELAISDVI